MVKTIFNADRKLVEYYLNKIKYSNLSIHVEDMYIDNDNLIIEISVNEKIYKFEIDLNDNKNNNNDNGEI